MTFKEIKSAVKHLQSTCKCQGCNQKYTQDDISIVATTKMEGLFELFCNQCALSAIVTVVITPEMEISDASTAMPRQHRSVSENDILDCKNFLAKFDGNFKKIFNKQK